MKIIFFGTSSFGILSLDALKQSTHQLLSIVTTPDKPQGRELKFKASPVKAWAQKNDLPYLEIAKKNPEHLPATLRSFGADIFVVISFGLILSRELLEVPKITALNVHSSLLPRYRGAAPIHWAMMNGDPETGVTIMRMTEKLDTGDILLQKKTPIMPEDDIVSLERKLSELGAQALLDAIAQIERGKAVFAPQKEEHASYARKITKEDGHILWSRPAAQVVNHIRALKSWPKSYAFYEGKRLLILGAVQTGEQRPANVPDGTILRSSQQNGIDVVTKDGVISVKQLQLEGKKPLDVHEFLKGFVLKEGQVLE